MSEDRTPILIGTGQITQRDADPAAALDPLGLMLNATRRAAADAGLGAAALASVDRVAVVSFISWAYANAPRLLAESIGAHPREELYTTIGGNTPQWLVNRTAEAIAAGRVRLALLAGAEALATMRRAGRADVQLDWSRGGAGQPTVVGDPRMGSSDHEMAHGLQLPVQIYPLFENALRARAGRAIAAHQAYLGELYARLSAVAAEHPHAWFREARSAEEIATVGPQNRMIAFPYPKYMNAILEVNQGAAVLMTSVAVARELGIPPSRWIYLLGAADAHDHWYVSERTDYTSSPAIRAAGAAALGAAGVGIDDVAHLDLYSCFPCAVQIARQALGIAEDDPRPLTVTGGLAHFGGAGNDYSMHAIATMVDLLRRDPAARGLVSALGWYMTKHAIGVYGAEPAARRFAPVDGAALQARIDAEPHPPLELAPAGRASVETYTVVYDRDGAPASGIVVGRLTDGRRFLARTPEDRSVLEALVSEEAVGLPGRASSQGPVNRFDPA